MEKKREGMAEANLTTLNSFGEPLMDAVCKNACSGHDVTKVRREEGLREGWVELVKQEVLIWLILRLYFRSLALL